VRVVAATHDIAFTGEDKEVQVEITNESEKEVKSLTVEMISYTTYFSKLRSGHIYSYWGGIHETKVIRNEVFKTTIQGNNFPVRPHAAWKGSIIVKLPSAISPTIQAHTSPLIHHRYLLRVTATTSGNIFTESSAKTEFEIAVGVRNPYSFAPPTACMGTPYTIQVAQLQQIQPVIPGTFNQDFSLGFSPLPPTTFNNLANAQQQFEEGENYGENWGAMLAQGKTPQGYGQILPTAPAQELPPALQYQDMSVPQQQQNYQAQPMSPYPGQPGAPGQPYPGQPGAPAQTYPGQPYPGQPGEPVQPMYQPYPGQPGQPAFAGNPPMYPGQPSAQYGAQQPGSF